MTTVFITGGTTGIGKQLALDYAKQGFHVGICGRNSEKYTEDLKAVETIKFYKADVFDQEQIKNSLNEFIKEQGSIDYFYANAGISAGAKSFEPNIEQDIKLMQVNVHGFLNSMAAVIPPMLKQKSGKIIAISSLGALFGLPGNAGYCASKAYVSTYAESMSVNLQKFGIQMSCILPGYITTPLTGKNNHPMPFLMDVDKASVLIRKAVEKGKLYYGFPWFFSSFCHFVGRLPKCLLHIILKRVKYS